MTPGRVVELRTHGVSGTPPESILRWDHVIQVAGDDDSRFHRRSTPDGVEVVAEPLAGRERVLESYHWGEMTSGGLAKAAWALLLPFAMTNLAQWTLPALRAREPVSTGRRRARIALVHLARAIIRLTALGLTMLFTVQIQVVVVDLVATQCLARDATCLDDVSFLDVLRRIPTLRAVLGVVVVGLVLGVVWYLGRDTLARRPRTPITTTPSPPDRKFPRVASAAFTDTCPWSGALRALHAMAAFAVATIVLTGGRHPAGGDWNAVTWGIALGFLVIAVVVVAVLDDPSGGTGRWRRLRGVFGRGHLGVVWGGLAAADLVLAAATTGASTLTREPPGGVGPPGLQLRTSENYVLHWLMPSLAVCCALLLVVVLLLKPLTRAGRRAMPRTFRPWLAGTLAPFAVALAALLAGGFGTAASVFADNCLANSCKPRSFGSSSTTLSRPAIYDAVALMWGIVVVVVAAAAILGAVAAWILLHTRLVKGRRQAVQRRLQEVEPGDEGAAYEPAMRSPWFLANLKFTAQWVLAGVTVVAVVAGLVALIATDREPDEPAWVRWLVHPFGAVVALGGTFRDGLGLTNPKGGYIHLLEAVGVFGLVAAIGWVLTAIWKAARDPEGAKNLGVAWDVVSFWPAEAHPFVPSGYAQRALPDLQARVAAHLADPTTRVVLCGHSQGSMIVYAVAWRLLADPHQQGLDRFGLVTHGSQLRWIFPRVFPGMLDFTDHRHLMERLHGRWENVVRYTDPVGGQVLSWNLTAEAAPGRIRGDALVLTPTGSDPLGTPTTSTPCCVGVQVVGHEHWLPDPVLPHPGPLACAPPGGEAIELSGALREHSDFPYDRHWPHVVARAAGLEAVTDEPAPARGRQRRRLFRSRCSGNTDATRGH